MLPVAAARVVLPAALQGLDRQQLLLQHIALAWYRLSRLDETVQQAAFLVMQQMYAAYYAPQDICVQDSRLLALHQALAAKNYGQYLAAAENLT